VELTRRSDSQDVLGELTAEHPDLRSYRMAWKDPEHVFPARPPEHRASTVLQASNLTGHR
jgi:hypothetical protein